MAKNDESPANHDERPTTPQEVPDRETDSDARGGEVEPASDAPAEPEQQKLEHTRTAGTWAAVVVATAALIVLLVFILQNLQLTTVTFLGLRGDLPVGVALLLAAAIGGLLVAFVGAARILQLRRTARRTR